MRAGLTIPADTQERMVYLYTRRGMTLARVAAETYWSAGAVRRVLLAHGVELRHVAIGHSQMSNDEKLARAQLYGMGYSLAEIADMRGCSPSSVVYALERMGVARRSLSEAARVAYARGRKVPALTSANRARLGTGQETS